MRSKNAFYNLIASLGFELFIFVMGLIIPRFVILSYGDEVNGLTQTINRLLSLIKLIQAGAVGASIYQMYKPVAEDDYYTQSSILKSSKKFFNKTGAIYLSIALSVGLAYGFYLQDANLSVFEIFLSFAILALNGSLSFFFTSRYDIYFSAHQKRYVMLIISFIERATYYALLIFIMVQDLPFMAMYFALLTAGLLSVAVNAILFKRATKNKLQKVDENETFIIKDRKYLMMSSIGNESITAAPTVLVTTFVGLAYSSVFAVYSMIFVSMKTIINSVQLSISSIFGNLVATSKDEKIARVFNLVTFVFFMLGALLASCSAFLFMPFIKLYTAGFIGVNYVWPILSIFVVVYIALFSVYILYAFVSNIYGLFKLNCKITLSVGLVGVIVSALCTWLFGMPYVMVGVLLYYVISSIVLMGYLKKNIAWFNFKKLIRRILLLIALPTASYILSTLNLITVSGWMQWFVVALIFALAVMVVIIVYGLIFEIQELKSLIAYAKTILGRKKKVKKDA